MAAPLEQAIAKLAAIAQAKGISIEDLIAMFESGASMADVLKALNIKEQEFD